MRDLLEDLDGQGIDPMRSAQAAMRRPLPKRFYTQVTVGTGEDGLSRVLLDGRAVRTPGKAEIALAGAGLAQLIADEFAAQGETIDPATMPVYRLVNTAIDGVATDMQAVAEDVTRFFGSDLLCYRAEGPDGLVARQREAWDPLLDWMETRIHQRFILAEGVMHVAQPKTTIAAAGAVIAAIGDPVVLAGLHLMTTLTGSAVLALAVLEGEITAQAAWAAAHVDEDWNIAQWGEDAEAKAMRALKWRDMAGAAAAVRAALA